MGTGRLWPWARGFVLVIRSFVLVLKSENRRRCLFKRRRWKRGEERCSCFRILALETQYLASERASGKLIEQVEVHVRCAEHCSLVVELESTARMVEELYKCRQI